MTTTCMDTLAAASPPVDPAGFVEGVWNPEDLVTLQGSPWVAVSAMRSRGRRGALLAVHRDMHGTAVELAWSAGAEGGRLGADVFDPHGIAARPLGDGSHELLVVDHGGGEAVARLRIDARGERPLVVEGTRLVQPPGTSGNAVAHMPDGGFVLTSMFDPAEPDIRAAFAEGRLTGGVWRWSGGTGWRPFGRLGLSGANGIAATADGSAVFVSEWAARRVWRLGSGGEALAQAPTPFLPDNLRWMEDGRLLLAGQAARPEAVFGCEARGVRCPFAFEVVALDPVTLAMTSLISADEAQARTWGFGGATGALKIGADLWVGSFTGERIARFSHLLI